MISLTLAATGEQVLVNPAHISTVMPWDGSDMVGECRHTPGSIVMTVVSITLVIKETVNEVERILL